MAKHAKHSSLLDENDSSDDSLLLDYSPFGSRSSKKRTRREKEENSHRKERKRSRQKTEQDVPPQTEPAAVSVDVPKDEGCVGGRDDSDKDSIASEDMETPYAENLLSDDDDIDWDEDTLSDKRTEPLRPGDVIAYCDPIFVAGDSRGKRKATVLNTDPDRSTMITLSNGEILPNDTEVKRTKVFEYGKLHPHPHGLFRPIESFRITKLGSGGLEAGVQHAARRVSRIVDKNVAKLQKRAKLDGFAPTDILHKGINSRISKGNPTTSSDPCESIESFSDESRPPKRRAPVGPGPSSTLRGRRTKRLCSVKRRYARSSELINSESEVDERSVLHPKLTGIDKPTWNATSAALSSSESSDSEPIGFVQDRKRKNLVEARPKHKDTLTRDSDSEASVDSVEEGITKGARPPALTNKTSLPRRVGVGLQHTRRGSKKAEKKTPVLKLSSLRKKCIRNDNDVGLSSDSSNHSACRSMDSTGKTGVPGAGSHTSTQASPNATLSSIQQTFSPVVDLTQETKLASSTSMHPRRRPEHSEAMEQIDTVGTPNTRSHKPDYSGGAHQAISSSQVSGTANFSLSFSKQNRAPARRVERSRTPTKATISSAISFSRVSHLDSFSFDSDDATDSIDLPTCGNARVPVGKIDTRKKRRHSSRKDRQHISVTDFLKTPTGAPEGETDFLDSDDDDESRRPALHMKRLSRSAGKSSAFKENLKASPQSPVEDMTSNWNTPRTCSSKKTRKTYGSRSRKYHPKT